jgi:transposase-like protein
MRPDRAIVQQAIRDARGNLSRTATILGCSRQTLYTWIYQLGLEKLAGIRIDTRDGLDKRERKDTSDGNNLKRLSNRTPSGSPNLSLVAAQAMVERDIPATVKLPESLWKKIRTKAIWEGVLVSKLVQKALEDSLVDEPPVRKRGKTNGGDSQ